MLSLTKGLGCPLSSTAVGLAKKKSSGVSFPSSKLVKNGEGLSASTKKFL